MKKCLLYPLSLILEVWDLKITYGKSCGLHILVGSDLTCDLSFNVNWVVDTFSTLYLLITGPTGLRCKDSL